MYATISMQEKGQKEMRKQYKFKKKKQIILMCIQVFFEICKNFTNASHAL